MIILILLARLTEFWAFYLPIVSSAALLLGWGTFLRHWPRLLPEKIQKSAPKDVADNLRGAIVYSLFLVPRDVYSAVSLIPYTASAIAIACLTRVAGLQFAILIVGTFGLVPARFWWYILGINDD